MVVAATAGGDASACQTEDHALELIESYYNSSWQNASIARQDWDDCTQETFVRLLNRVSRNRLIEAITNAKFRERRELNRSIWCIVQRWRRAARPSQMRADEVPDDCNRSSKSEIDLSPIFEAIVSENSGLSPRRQDILSRWLSGMSIAEIASSLQIPASHVSDEKYKALRKIRSLKIWESIVTC
jgi:RNA polymerase sigma factor (sigma-70 family)